MSLLTNFPHKDFRKHQRETIERIDEAFQTVDDVILESPPGSGKTAIAITLGLYYKPSFILTSQKILQDQYVRDYSANGVSVLKGRTNYPCAYISGFNCKEGCDKILDKCPVRTSCEYESAKNRAKSSPVALMNYTYFFHVMEYAKTFDPRKLLICDEIHSLENDLLKMIEFSFSGFTLSKLGVTGKIPTFKQTVEYIYWMQDILDRVQVLLFESNEKLEQMKSDLQITGAMDGIFEQPDIFNLPEVASVLPIEEQEKVMRLNKEVDELSTLKTKIQKFISTCGTTEWVFDMMENRKIRTKTIIFKPLDVCNFTDGYLLNMGKKRLYMSATVGSKNNMCKILGINKDKCEFIKVPSTFPVEKMPIYLTNSGKMDKDSLDSTLPKIAEDINKILNHHIDEKGIIHCHTYKIANYIKDNVEQKERLIIHDSTNRESQLNEFLASKDNHVLISPSMTDGIDLKDDLARFVVIVKIPYLFLGDKQIKRKMEVDSEWYRWKAALTLVQAAGRAMRHEDDSCEIYIMDSSIKWFIKQNIEYFPRHFLDSIQN